VLRIVIVFLVLVLCGSAWAQGRGHSRGGGGGMQRHGGGGQMQYHDRSRGGGNWSGMGRSGQRWRGFNNDLGTAIVGGAIGSIFGNWFSQPEPQVIIVPQEREVPELACEQKYRSFVRATGTYTGFDGLAHAAVGCQ